MKSFLTRIATSVSWIAALPAISSCATDPDLSVCADDVGYETGLDIHLAGAANDVPYDIEVVADGTAVSLHQPPGGLDNVAVDLGDGLTMSASVNWYDEFYQLENGGNVLQIGYRRAPDESGWGPTTATIEVTLDGEAVEESFTPAYDLIGGWGPPCHGNEHAFVEMGVPTP